MVLLEGTSYAQQPDHSGQLAISSQQIGKASLWNPYSFRLQAAGGAPPYHWRVVSGSLPPGLRLEDDGELSGHIEDSAGAEFTVSVTDNRRALHEEKAFALQLEKPLLIDWSHKAQVNGTRIDGGVKVSNQTGRDLDLTFVVLAVNDIGRATAIGYQHFSLAKNTKDQELPFGENLSPGNYAVHVDVVGEEAQSNRIFRARLVVPKQAITQGP
jgi:hypothetical protein